MWTKLLPLFLLALEGYSSSGICALPGTITSGKTITGIQLFNFNGFSASDTSLLTLVGTANIVGDALQLTQQATNGGVLGYAWTTERQRIADGFVSSVEFSVFGTQNAGDGFTFFIQNDAITDLNGGTGANLGAFGIQRSIGVLVDLCVDRPNSCNIQQVKLQLINSSFGNALPTVIAPKNVSSFHLTNGEIHTLEVAYDGRLFGQNAALTVTLDKIQLFSAIVGDLASPSLFDGRFAFFGFTASTSWTETATININTWSAIIMPSDSNLELLQAKKANTINFNNVLQVDFGTTVEFLIIRLTSCEVPTGINDNATVNATLTPELGPEINVFNQIALIGNVTNNLDGTYTISFNFPNDIIATWDLSVAVDGVQPNNLPWVGFIQTVKPLPTGGTLPIWGLILLLVIILLIILVLSYIVYRLYRYRKKLKENSEFIEAGKKQAELDRLEDGTSYVANPMVGTIDDLRTQLGKNEAELEELRRRGMLGEDQNFTIEQLQKQRDALLEEMNRLKREEQEEELKKTKPVAGIGAGTRAKKEFGREQI